MLNWDIGADDIQVAVRKKVESFGTSKSQAGDGVQVELTWEIGLGAVDNVRLSISIARKLTVPEGPCQRRQGDGDPRG